MKTLEYVSSPKEAEISIREIQGGESSRLVARSGGLAPLDIAYTQLVRKIIEWNPRAKEIFFWILLLPRKFCFMIGHIFAASGCTRADVNSLLTDTRGLVVIVKYLGF